MVQAESLANPFVAGSPLTRPEMFFGRQDVFEFIRNALVGRHQDNIIVLYGKRRTGKTSVLYQMHRHIEQRYIPILIDLQALSMEGLPGFFWELAATIRRILRRDYDIDLSRPLREEFLDDPLQTFQSGFLDQALTAIGDRHLLLMIDEASRLQEQVEVGKLPAEVFGQIRSLMQHSRQLDFIFCIGERLETMQAQYTTLFNLALYKEISFLDRAAAELLITQPVRDFYSLTDAAVDRIIEVTSGHPYFMQLLCHSLFSCWQRDQKPQLDVDDVNAVMNEVVERGAANLRFEWDQLGPVEKLMLAAMAHMMRSTGDIPSMRDIRNVLSAFGIDVLPGDLATAQRNLINGELISGESLRFTVDFMRWWVQEHQKLEWLKEELVTPIEELRHAAARRRPARVRLMLVLAGVVVAGTVLLALLLLRGGSSVAGGIASTVAVDRCQVIDIQGVYTIDWCVTTAEVLGKTEQVRLNVAWSAHILKPESGQVVQKGRIDTVSCPVDPKKCLYLEDPTGKQFHVIALGAAAAEDSLLRDGDTVQGWFLFPPLPKATSFTFVFPEDDLRIENIRLQ
jgi:hypothetical protein